MLQNYFIHKCNLLERLVNAFPQEDDIHRPGYMGHVIILCQTIENVCSSTKDQQSKTNNDEEPAEGHIFNNPKFGIKSKIHLQPIQSPQFVLIIEEHPFYDTWSSFVSTTLAAALSIQTTPLGIPLTSSSSEQIPTLENSSIEML